MDVKIGGFHTQAYPALVDYEDSVSIELFDSKQEADLTHIDGLRRLLLFAIPDHRKLLKKPLPEWQKISLMYANIGHVNDLQLEVFYKAQDLTFFSEGSDLRNKSEFDSLVRTKSKLLPGFLAEVACHIRDALTIYRNILGLMDKYQDELTAECVTDINSQLEWLIYPGFVGDISAAWLQHVPRFLKGVEIRISQARLDGAEDSRRLQKVLVFWEAYLQLDSEYSQALDEYRWMIEEYRISVFAQSLKTSQRVSARRLENALSNLQNKVEHS